MDRILIIGSGGAGKSTLARRLSETTGLPAVHLDRLYWRPDWQKIGKDEWAAIVERETEKDRWIMDGNFGGTLDLRIKRADTIVFLDLPRLVCLYRVIRRRLTYRGTNRPDMAEGCHEKIDLEFLFWIWNYPAKHGAEWRDRIREKAPHVEFVHLTSQAQVDGFEGRVGKK